jgi:hypothetical protein
LVPELDGPMYKVIFSNICLLLPASDFPIMINPAQIAWFFYSITYSLPSTFSRVRFEQSTLVKHFVLAIFLYDCNKPTLPTVFHCLFHYSWTHTWLSQNTVTVHWIATDVQIVALLICQQVYMCQSSTLHEFLPLQYTCNCCNCNSDVWVKRIQVTVFVRAFSPLH